MKKFTLIVLAAGLAVTAACTASTTDDALPEGSDQFPTSSTVAGGAVKTETTTAPKPTTTTTTEAAPAASTCDVTREAFLTGTQAEINASLKALMADKTADSTAREYADYYLNRDKGEPEMQKMDVTLIRMSCSI